MVAFWPKAGRGGRRRVSRPVAAAFDRKGGKGRVDSPSVLVSAGHQSRRQLCVSPAIDNRRRLPSGPRPEPFCARGPPGGRTRVSRLRCPRLIDPHSAVCGGMAATLERAIFSHPHSRFARRNLIRLTPSENCPCQEKETPGPSRPRPRRNSIRGRRGKGGFRHGTHSGRRESNDTISPCRKNEGRYFF